MFQEKTELTYGEGKYTIHIAAVITADGLSITITGGERPHVGGMAMSLPRTDSVQEQPICCDTWIVPRPYHRDADVASLVSKIICQETGHCTAVVAGIHIDHAQPHEIDILVENSRVASYHLIDKIRAVMER